MDYFTILKLPYAVFLGLLKHFRIFILQQTPEGQEYLRKAKLINKKEPDWRRIRGLEGYRKVKGAVR